MERFDQETQRIQAAYARRDKAGAADRYSWHRPEVILLRQSRDRAIAKMLVAEGLTDVSALSVLDVGCGNGDWLRQLQQWGGDANRLQGVDLLFSRIKRAKQFGTGINFLQSDGWPLPFDDGAFDLATANMVFSSILDADARATLASEMFRVLRPGGHVLIYDFVISHPANPDTIGIGDKEIRRIFQGARCRRQRLTLAPPVARRIARISPLLAHGLESLLPFLRTHKLHLLTKDRR